MASSDLVQIMQPDGHFVWYLGTQSQSFGSLCKFWCEASFGSYIATLQSNSLGEKKTWYAQLFAKVVWAGQAPGNKVTKAN